MPHLKDEWSDQSVWWLKPILLNQGRHSRIPESGSGTTTSAGEPNRLMLRDKRAASHSAIHRGSQPQWIGNDKLITCLRKASSKKLEARSVELNSE
jgi:hypothetical protein